MDPVALVDRVAAGFSLLGYRLPRILADPRAYPRETMILAVIAAVLIITMVMLLILAREWVQARAVRARMRLRRHPVDRVRALLTAVAVVALVCTVAALAPLVPVAGPACGLCHATGLAVDSWERGSHESVSCYSCHARPGVTGALEATVRGAGALAGAMPRPVADSGSCTGCHERITAVTIVSDGMRVSHREMIDAGMVCLLCHSDVGHGEPGDPTEASGHETGRVTRPIMNRCVACHDGVKAPGECDVCHTSDPSDTKDGPTAVGVTPTGVTCDGCHRESTAQGCIECHGLEMPHPEDFLRRHAGLSAQDAALCASCHEDARASEGCACHLDANQHGTYSDWFPRHGPIASVNGAGGCGCHDAGFCQKCHDDDPFE